MMQPTRKYGQSLHQDSRGCVGLLSADKTNSPAKRQDLEISAESAGNKDGSVKLRITLIGKGNII